MPIIKSAKKRMRQNVVRRERNRARRTRLRSAIRALNEAIDAGDAATAHERWTATQSIIDRTARLGVIHPNRAARTKARLKRRIQQLAG